MVVLPGIEASDPWSYTYPDGKKGKHDPYTWDVSIMRQEWKFIRYVWKSPSSISLLDGKLLPNIFTSLDMLSIELSQYDEFSDESVPHELEWRFSAFREVCKSLILSPAINKGISFFLICCLIPPLEWARIESESLLGSDETLDPILIKFHQADNHCNVLPCYEKMNVLFLSEPLMDYTEYFQFALHHMQKHYISWRSYLNKKIW